MSDVSNTQKNVPALQLDAGGTAMVLYEFRTISHGKTIWTAEHYCQSDIDALDQAARSAKEFEVRVWQNGHRISPLSARRA